MPVNAAQALSFDYHADISAVSDAGLPLTEADRVFYQTIEEVVMFGKLNELEGLLTKLDGDQRLPQGLRHDVEGLLHYRNHYQSISDLPLTARLKVAQYDAEQTMYIVNKLHSSLWSEGAA